jgi:hypothetical protein
MRTAPERYDRVLAHPTYTSAPPEPVGMPWIGIADMTPSSLLSAAISLVIAMAILLQGRHTPVMQLILIGVVAGTTLGIVGLVRRLRSLREAPTRREIAVVVKERPDVGRRFGDRQARTRYYAMLQTRDGRRTECFVPASVVGRFAVDDIGIAYTKANVLVEFIRVDVDRE